MMKTTLVGIIKVMIHYFNRKRLVTISTLAQISAQCMRPQGKIKQQENISLHTVFKQ